MVFRGCHRMEREWGGSVAGKPEGPSFPSELASDPYHSMPASHFLSRYLQSGKRTNTVKPQHKSCLPEKNELWVINKAIAATHSSLPFPDPGLFYMSAPHGVDSMIYKWLHALEIFLGLIALCHAPLVQVMNSLINLCYFLSLGSKNLTPFSDTKLMLLSLVPANED